MGDDEIWMGQGGKMMTTRIMMGAVGNCPAGLEKMDDPLLCGFTFVDCGKSEKIAGSMLSHVMDLERKKSGYRMKKVVGNGALSISYRLAGFSGQP